MANTSLRQQALQLIDDGFTADAISALPPGDAGLLGDHTSDEVITEITSELAARTRHLEHTREFVSLGII